MSDIQYRDLHRTFKTNSRGDITELTGGDALVQRFLNRLLTPVGSRLSRPNFGSRLHEVVHELTDEESAAFIEMEIYRVAELEPGVNVRNIEINNFLDQTPRRRNVVITVTSPILSREQKVGVNVMPDGIEPASS